MISLLKICLITSLFNIKPTKTLLADLLKSLSHTKSGFTTPLIVIASAAKQSLQTLRLLRCARNDDCIERIRSIQHYLGHKNIQHRVRYTALSPNVLEISIKIRTS